MSLPPPAPPRLPPGLRVYAVGDVHGRLDLMLAMERLIAADQAGFRGETIEVWLGDYIDRGPDSKGAVERLIARAEAGERLVTLRGNHEAYILDFPDDPNELRRWLKFGGRSALASYGLETSAIGDEDILAHAPELTAAALAAIDERHLAFYRRTLLSWRAGDYFFVHAGVRPGVALDRQEMRDLISIREPFHSHEGDFGAFVVHGHTPALEPVVRSNRICLDTTAWDTGVLTCLVLEGAERRFLASG